MKEDAKTQITIVSSTGGNSKNSSPTEISGIRKMGLGSVEIDASKSGVQTESLIVSKEKQLVSSPQISDDWHKPIY